MLGLVGCGSSGSAGTERVTGEAAASAAPQPIVARALLLVSGPVGNGFVGHVWVAPGTRGGECDLLVIDRRRTAGPLPAGTRPRSCSLEPSGKVTIVSASRPLTVGISMGLRPPSGSPRLKEWVPPVIDGDVYLKLNAARVAVEWRGGSRPLTLSRRNSHFIGGGSFLYKPPFENLPYYIVAYDQSGKVVARQKLDSSVIEFMNGWKEFTPKYLRWKRARRR